MSAEHCQVGRYRAATLTQARTDLANTARKATRSGIGGERAQRHLADRKANVEKAREALTEHEATCGECMELAR